MANLKISDYVDVDSIAGNELILVSKNGSYRKTSIEEIRNLAADIANTALSDLVGKAANAHDVKNIINIINDSLENHSNSIEGINSSLSQIPNQYVAQVTGKGLSANDYDNTEKAKVALITNKADTVDLNTQKARIDNLVATSSGSFYEKCLSTDTGALLIVASSATTGQINLSSVTPVATGYTPISGDYVKLVYGVASGSAELIDARTGILKVYSSVGEAMRDIAKGNGVKDGSLEFRKLLTDYFDIQASSNIFDSNNTIANYILDSTGKPVVASGYSYNIIRCEVGHTYTFYRKSSDGSNLLTNIYRYVIYDVNLNALAVGSNTAGSQVTIDPSLYPTAYYIAKNFVNTEVQYWTKDFTNATIVNYESYYKYFKIKPDYLNLSKVGVKDWYGKTWLNYGDSISAINNGNSLSVGWAQYINNYFGFSAFYGRGIGGQNFTWNTDTWYANSDGSYADRSPNAQPANTTIHLGAFCSWDRIKTMINDSIKDTLDLIFIMGGTNDWAENCAIGTTNYDVSNTTDTLWQSDTTYRQFAGDYDISTFKGGIASTIMKIQARCPNAIIVLGTQLSGAGTTAGVNQTDVLKNSLGLTSLDYVNALKEVAKEFSIPVIDVYGTTGINQLNRAKYLTDQYHPYGNVGQKVLARSVIGGLKGIIPNII